MYNKYFGLSENPFSIAPNPRFLYMSKRHKEALAHLLYGVSEGGGFVMLTGEVGTGKTTICRCLLEQLPDHCELAFILNPKLTAIELLATICDDLRIEYPAENVSVKFLMDALSKHLIEKHQQGKRVVLMIDEAQNLAPDVLEQIRLLTNLETNTEKLLQIILIGQPELKALLNRRILRQLAQRVTARYHLEPLSEAETHEYITHRLSIAGQKFSPFNDKAIKMLHQISGGIPRLINSICDRAMLGAYVLNKRHIEPKVIKKAAKEVLGEQAKDLAAHSSEAEALLSIQGDGVYLSKKAFFAGVGGISFLLLAFVVTQWYLLAGTQINPQNTPVTVTKVPVSQSRIQTVERGPQSTQTSFEAMIARADTREISEPEQARAEVNELLASIWGEQAWVREKNEAQQALFSLWDVDYNEQSDGNACDFAEKKRLKCENDFGNWQTLMSLNRPAVLKFVTKEQGGFYGTLVKVYRQNEEIYGEVKFGQRTAIYSLEKLSALWSGDFTLVWQMPPGYDRPVKAGVSGPIVTWLREKLAALAGASTYEAITEYDESLSRRIKAFQRANNLVADGIAGAQTMIFINSYTNEEVPRLYSGELPTMLAQRGTE